MSFESKHTRSHQYIFSFNRKRPCFLHPLLHIIISTPLHASKARAWTWDLLLDSCPWSWPHLKSNPRLSEAPSFRYIYSSARMKLQVSDIAGDPIFSTILKALGPRSRSHIDFEASDRRKKGQHFWEHKKQSSARGFWECCSSCLSLAMQSMLSGYFLQPKEVAKAWTTFPQPFTVGFWVMKISWRK